MINILFLHVTCFYLILLFQKVDIVATQLEHTHAHILSLSTPGVFARFICMQVFVSGGSSILAYKLSSSVATMTLQTDKNHQTS